MTNPSASGLYLTAVTEDGLLVIHGSPVTLSWIPRDVVNNAYNTAGAIAVGEFASPEAAKQAAEAQYLVSPDSWEASDAGPFTAPGNTHTENHTPDVEGHKLMRHGIRWK